MLEYIADMFESLVDIVISLGQLVVNLVEGLFDFLGQLPVVLTMLTSSIGNLPDVVLPFAAASITIAVVLLVLGRQNQT